MNKDKAIDFLAEYFDGKDYTLTGRREALRIAEYIISDIDILEDAGELAELRAKAEKWDKLNKMLHDECGECPFNESPYCRVRDEDPCEAFKRIVDAIEGTKEA